MDAKRRSFARDVRVALWPAALGLVVSACGSGGGGPESQASSTGSGATSGASSGAGGGATGPGGLRWIGRVDAGDPKAARFAWSGSGLAATVEGVKISVSLQTEGAVGTSFFQPVIDGVAGPRFQVKNGPAETVVLADKLSAGEHTVELYRDTEGMLGDSVFRGFVDGIVKGAPPAKHRLIEVVGDSITAGYGNLGSEVHPPWDNACTFSLDTEAAYQSYGWMLGRALDAEVSLIACSGWGMYRGNQGSLANVLPSVYENTVGTQASPLWDFQQKAGAVIINLGTNDAGTPDPGKPFEDAYLEFLKTVRGHHPDAWIFMTIGPMTLEPDLTLMRTHLANVAAAASAGGDKKVMTVDLAIQDTSTTGCDYHPNVAEDKVMANALLPTIKAKLGW